MGHRVEVQTPECAHLGQRQQMHQRLGHGAQRPLGADDQLGDVEVARGACAPRASAVFDQSRCGVRATRARIRRGCIRSLAAGSAESGPRFRRDSPPRCADRRDGFGRPDPCAAVAGAIPRAPAAPAWCGEPSDSTHVEGVTLSTVLPCQIERAPAELLPIMPPRLARLLVATSGPNCRPCGARRGVELVEHDARLHRAVRNDGIDLDADSMILAEVDDDARADRLPRQAGAAAARDDRQPMFGGDLHGGHDVVARARHDDAERFDVVDAGVGAV